VIDVVVAVIQRADGGVLIAQRQVHQDMAGLYEFPGGKREAGESLAQALVRELQEEVGITPTHHHFLMEIPWHYAHKSVCLHVFQVTDWQGDPQGVEGQTVQWLSVDALRQDQFPVANAQIVEYLHANR
jgi:8-oxo-dGTP diphosphatase